MMFQRMHPACRLFLLVLLLLPPAARAGAVDFLRAFLDDTHSLRADFTQSVQAANGRAPRNTSGSLALQKPGRFRWEVDKPQAQLVLGDGRKVWLFDPDLAQVTVHKADAALGATPAALLAGNSAALRQFVVREVGEEAGLLWVEARPKRPEAGFERLLLGFSTRGELEAMRLFDNFGQETRLRFTRIQHNPVLPESLFRFVPPKGVDVLEAE
jgi:outer membrane lipoprotein carrier protein